MRKSGSGQDTKTGIVTKPTHEKLKVGMYQTRKVTSKVGGRWRSGERPQAQGSIEKLKVGTKPTLWQLTLSKELAHEEIWVGFKIHHGQLEVGMRPTQEKLFAGTKKKT